jgi:hypothetical protein
MPTLPHLIAHSRTAFPNFPLAEQAVLFPVGKIPMRILLMLFTVALFVGCAKDENGRSLTFGQTLQKWEDSMQATEDRLQSKRYND